MRTMPILFSVSILFSVTAAQTLGVQEWNDDACSSYMINIPCCDGTDASTWPGEDVTADACSFGTRGDEYSGIVFSCRPEGGWEATIDSSYGTSVAACNDSPTATCEAATTIPATFDGNAVDKENLSQGEIILASFPKGCKIVGESSSSCVPVIRFPSGEYQPYEYVVSWKVTGCPDPPPTAPPPSAPLCADTCSYDSDGTCDDGGPGSTFSFCSLGTDCVDCGVSTRVGGLAAPSAPSVPPSPPDPPYMPCTVCDDIADALATGLAIGMGLLIALIAIPIVVCLCIIGLIVYCCCVKPKRAKAADQPAHV